MGAAATVVNGTMMGKSASRERISVRRMMVASASGFELGEVVADAGADRVLDCYARKKHTPGPENRGCFAFDVSMVW